MAVTNKTRQQAWRERHPEQARASARDRMRRLRERRKLAAVKPPPELPTVHAPARALVEWARDALRVPPGHPAAGSPMVIPSYAADFLSAGWTAHESALSVARKNAKSAVCAALALAHLCGPLRRPGWRGAVASLSLGKAKELRDQVVAIAAASGLEITERRSPYPGAILSDTGSLETLSADKHSGAASSYDLVICDETGLMPERARDLLGGLRSSLSAKGGRIVHISVRGDSPLFKEVLENPANVVRVHAAPEGCAVDDRKAWAAANPTLGVVKQIAYMENEVQRIQAVPSDEASFRAFDLNQALSPSEEMLCQLSDWLGCVTNTPPERKGGCVVGLDLGGSRSMTAAVVLWPATGRIETYGAFPVAPSLALRGSADGCGRMYEQAAHDGELWQLGERTTNVQGFIRRLRERLAGERVIVCGADRYRRAEVEELQLPWPMAWRGQGASAKADGSHDVRACQRMIIEKRIRSGPSRLLESALANCRIRRDGSGNPALDKAKAHGRIDCASALVIACGLADIEGSRPVTWRPGGLV